ncbi:phenylalanine 4-monooxygenase [Streptomyces sp. NPDC003006]
MEQSAPHRYSSVVRDSRGEISVSLAPGHPGHGDVPYQRRRSAIARAAVTHTPGRRAADVHYTPEEEDLWRSLFADLSDLHRKHACQEFLQGAERLALPTGGLPQLGEVSDRLGQLTHFGLDPAPGLLPPLDFHGPLAERRFQATQYIRHSSTPGFSPEPDMVHEIVGHGAALAHGRWADLYQHFGRTIRRLRTLRAMESVSKVFWFTMESGLLRENGETKAYGASLLSSTGELAAYAGAEIRPLDARAILAQEYAVDGYQPVYYCAASFEHLDDFLTDFLTRTDDTTWTG